MALIEGNTYEKTLHIECSLGNLVYFQKSHISNTFLQNIIEDHQKSIELDLNNSTCHHPSLDNSSSSSVDAIEYDLKELELHYPQRHAMVRRRKHLNDEGPTSKTTCSTFLLDGKLIEVNWRLFNQES